MGVANTVVSSTSFSRVALCTVACTACVCSRTICALRQYKPHLLGRTAVFAVTMQLAGTHSPQQTERENGTIPSFTPIILFPFSFCEQEVEAAPANVRLPCEILREDGLAHRLWPDDYGQQNLTLVHDATRWCAMDCRAYLFQRAQDQAHFICWHRAPQQLTICLRSTELWCSEKFIRKNLYLRRLRRGYGKRVFACKFTLSVVTYWCI